MGTDRDGSPYFTHRSPSRRSVGHDGKPKQDSDTGEVEEVGRHPSHCVYASVISGDVLIQI